MGKYHHQFLVTIVTQEKIVAAPAKPRLTVSTVSYVTIRHTLFPTPPKEAFL